MQLWKRIQDTLFKPEFVLQVLIDQVFVLHLNAPADGPESAKRQSQAIKSVAENLERSKKDVYMICNFTPYGDQLQKRCSTGQVVDFYSPSRAVENFYHILYFCHTACQWVSAAPNHCVVFAFMTESDRHVDYSAMLCTCYLLFGGYQTYGGGSAMSSVAKLYNLMVSEKYASSQNTYVELFHLLFTLPQIPNTNRLRLIKLSLHHYKRTVRGIEGRTTAPGTPTTSRRGTPRGNRGAARSSDVEFGPEGLPKLEIQIESEGTIKFTTSDYRAWVDISSDLQNPGMEIAVDCTLFGDFTVSVFRYEVLNDEPVRKNVLRYCFSTIFVHQQQHKIKIRDMDYASADETLDRNFFAELCFGESAKDSGDDDYIAQLGMRVEKAPRRLNGTDDDVSFNVPLSPGLGGGRKGGNDDVSGNQGRAGSMGSAQGTPSNSKAYAAQKLEADDDLFDLINELKKELLLEPLMSHETSQEVLQEEKKKAEARASQRREVITAQDEKDIAAVLEHASSGSGMSPLRHSFGEPSPGSPGIGGGGVTEDGSFSNDMLKAASAVDGPEKPAPPTGLPQPPASKAPPPPPGKAPPPPPGKAPPPPPGKAPPPPPGKAPPPLLGVKVAPSPAGLPPPPPGKGGLPLPPPPPGKGGLPPPPPPGFGLGPPKPSGPKLKSFFWKKVSEHKAQSGLWAGLAEDDENDAADTVDEDFLLEMFEQKAVVKKPKEDGATDKDVVKRTTSVSGQRQQNIGIALSKIKKTPEVIRDALIKCDKEVLTDEVLEAVFRILPQADEIKGLKIEKERGLVTWEAPEVFLFEVGVNVPDVADRLQLWSSTLEIDMVMPGITQQMANQEQVVAALMAPHSKFKKVLKVVLHVGNFMNRGTTHGNAKGFSLENLAMLNFVKANDGKTTMLEVIVKQVRDKKPELLDFTEELKCLQTSITCPMANTSQEVSTLSMGVQKMKRAVEQRKPGGKVKVLGEELGLVDGLPALLQACITAYGGKVAALVMQHQGLKDDVMSMMEHYGEDPKGEETEMLQQILNFCKEFEKVCKTLGPAPARPTSSSPAPQSRKQTPSGSPVPPTRHVDPLPAVSSGGLPAPPMGKAPPPPPGKAPPPPPGKAPPPPPGKALPPPPTGLPPPPMAKAPPPPPTPKAPPPPLTPPPTNNHDDVDEFAMTL